MLNPKFHITSEGKVHVYFRFHENYFFQSGKNMENAISDLLDGVGVTNDNQKATCHKACLVGQMIKATVAQT